MIKNYLNLLLRFSQRRTSVQLKIFSLLAGAIFFLIIFPVMLYCCGLWASRYLTMNWPRWLEIVVVIVTISIGLFFLSWATLTQWKFGSGTPVPNAPTQKLIIQGPYQLCRNPIELGAILYYLGVGTAFGSLTIGIFSSLLGFLIGSSYHKFVEEKDLELRFGDDYLKYKQETPFIIPQIYRKKLGARRNV
jgi:protein-S-isoprenylcysteine O-methyltransferase Ste14